MIGEAEIDLTKLEESSLFIEDTASKILNSRITSRQAFGRLEKLVYRRKLQGFFLLLDL
jgi:hypothetical protein